MADAERVMIYATGRDSRLREMCWTLLRDGLASYADLLDRASIYLKNGDAGVVGSSGRAVAVICRRDDLDEVFATMKRAYMDEGLTAFAVPVIATL